jgi:hypothetical protein
MRRSRKTDPRAAAAGAGRTAPQPTNTISHHCVLPVNHSRRDNRRSCGGSG